MPVSHWKEELETIAGILRKILLEETVKWGSPVFTYEKKNLIGLAGFKHHFVITFFEGIFLEDKQQKLQAARTTTKAMRQWRMESKAEIDPILIKQYALECLKHVKEGRVYVKTKTDKSIPVEAAPELLKALKAEKTLEKTFRTLSPGKQKEYHNYIREAKQTATKGNRIEKIKPLILSGAGLNDRYKKI